MKDMRREARICSKGTQKTASNPSFLVEVELCCKAASAHLSQEFHEC